MISPIPLNINANSMARRSGDVASGNDAIDEPWKQEAHGHHKQRNQPVGYQFGEYEHPFALQASHWFVRWFQPLFPQCWARAWIRTSSRWESPSGRESRILCSLCADWTGWAWLSANGWTTSGFGDVLAHDAAPCMRSPCYLWNRWRRWRQSTWHFSRERCRARNEAESQPQGRHRPFYLWGVIMGWRDPAEDEVSGRLHDGWVVARAWNGHCRQWADWCSSLRVVTHGMTHMMMMGNITIILWQNRVVAYLREFFCKRYFSIIPVWFLNFSVRWWAVSRSWQQDDDFLTYHTEVYAHNHQFADGGDVPSCRYDGWHHWRMAGMLSMG